MPIDKEFMKEFDYNPQKYYVYGWVCSDWGGTYFYIGKGTGQRWKRTSNRSTAFTAILNNWYCFPVIIEDNLNEEEALMLEEETKKEFIFEKGFPIMDGEGTNSFFRSVAVREGKAKKRATDPNYREGRPRKKEIPQEMIEKVKLGEESIAGACRKLGICRSSWYNVVGRME